MTIKTCSAIRMLPHLATLVGLVAWSGIALGSSHREAPAISFDPAADNTDVYAWVEPGSRDTLYIIANWIPLEEPSGGPNFHKFSDDVLYEIHIARGGSSLDDVIKYEIEFRTSPIMRVDPANQTAALGGGKEFFSQLSGQTQVYTVYKVVGTTRTAIATDIPVTPVNIGPRTNTVTRAGVAYDDAFTDTFIRNMGAAGAEGQVWAGPRDDGFYVDLGGVFDLANLRGPGVAQDGVAGFNTHTIALSIPTTRLTANGQPPPAGAGAANTLGVWASSSRRKFSILRNRPNRPSTNYGPWIQVSRLGLPLINEAVIGLQDKDRFNASHPARDAALYAGYFLNPVVVRDAEAVGIYAALAVDPDALGLKFNRTDILDTISIKDGTRPINTVGDVLRVDMGVDSGFPNGRPLVGGANPDEEQADVTDVLLNVILAKGTIPAIGDGVSYNDKEFRPTFPFLALPWEGFSEGHGAPTP